MITSQLNEVINFVIIGVPEVVVLSLLVILLLKLKPQWDKVIVIGVLTALTILVFRVQLLITGIHTAAAIIVMALLVSYFYKIPKLPCLMASVVGLLIVNFYELAGFVIVKYIFHMDIDNLAQNFRHWTLFAWAKIILMALTALIIAQTNWYRKGRHNSPGQSSPM